MSILDTLITNRTNGATYNYTDFNRVAEAMQYVAARLRSCGCDVVVTPRTGWTREDFPSVAEMERYMRQLRKIRDALKLFAKSPPTPEASQEKDWLTVEEANHIEQILLDVEEMVGLTRAAYFYCGDLYAGEV